MLRLVRWLLVCIGALSAMAAMAIWFTGATPPTETADSARYLKPGPHAVAREDLVFTHHLAGHERRLDVRVWWPKGELGPLPVVVFSHGFMSTRDSMTYVNEALASRGYLVAAPNFPNTYRYSLEGPDAADVINQPVDVSAILNRLLDGADGFPAVDATSIGAYGLSLGGMTTLLAGYHDRVADPRIRAAVAIAPPTSMFVDGFFEARQLPLLVIGGTLDRVIDFEEHAAPMPDRIPGSMLLTIAGGSHIGFAEFAEPWLRWSDDPDGLACRAILANLETPPGEQGAPDASVDLLSAPPSICDKAFDAPRIHPGRQHMITQVAVTRFFEQALRSDAAEKAAAQGLLELAADFPEATLSAAAAR